MAEIGRRIKRRREELGLTQEELANKMGYKSKTTIAKIESGVNDIVQTKVVEFAKALDTTIPYLMGWEEKRAERLTAYAKKINVLGRVAAGIPIDAITDIIGIEEITADMAKTGEFFGLQIKGDSMIPAICDKDIVIVRMQNDAENGDTVIAQINGNEATCKRLRKYKDRIELIPNNPAYSVLEFSNEEILSKPVKILGKVVELRRKF